MSKRLYLKVGITSRDNPYKGIGTGFVYVVKFGNIYKIGRTRNPFLRLDTLQSRRRQKLDEYHLIPAQNVRLAERKLHEHFERARIEGEMFYLTETQFKTIRSITKFENGRFTLSIK